VLEKRVMALSEELRCLVCQNQTIAESHAELAIDLRNQVREQLAAGRSEQQVTDYMVQRYGDFVLYRPPVKRLTWLLWGGPFGLLAAGLALLFVRLRGRRDVAEAVPQDQLARAAALLDAKPDNKEIQ
jgi:cytochrome c-type biogenesis protein CcmH